MLNTLHCIFLPRQGWRAAATRYLRAGLRAPLSIAALLLLCCWSPARADEAATPVAFDHACAVPALFQGGAVVAADWRRGQVTVRPGDKVCWLRISAPPVMPRMLSVNDTWLNVTVFDATGATLASSEFGGARHNAVVGGLRQAFYLDPAAPTPLYVKLSLSPRVFYRARSPTLESVDIDPVTRQIVREDATNASLSTFLLVIALLCGMFGIVLRDVNYGLFALYALSVGFGEYKNSGLVNSLSDSPVLQVGLSAAIWPFANAVTTLLFARLGNFRRHSPLGHRLNWGLGCGFVLLVPLSAVQPALAGMLNVYLLLAWYPVLLMCLWHSWRARERSSGMLLVVVLLRSLYWWPIALATLLPAARFGWYDIRPGGWMDMVQVLMLPCFICAGMALRTRRLRRDAMRMIQQDRLTRLPNRERIALLGEQWQTSPVGGTMAVLALDIDRFTAINETLGYDLGDAVIVEVGRRLSAIPQAVVGRVQADQFCLLWPDCATLDALRQRIEADFAAPIAVGEQTVDVSLSVGVASPAGESVAMLMRDAEIALNIARQRKNGWACYTPQMESGKHGDLNLLSELKVAVEKNQLRVYLQPKVRLDNGRVDSAEALVRWHHPVRGMVPPGEFIPFAEQTGKIGALTQWMLRESMALAVQWREQGQPLQISVNLSAFDLRDPAFVVTLDGMADATGVTRADIRLEVTESGVMEDPQAALAVLHALRDAGFTLSIDDFGTGYSSLAYLQKLPAAELKIDRSFIAGVTPGSDGEVLLISIIDLGHRMNLSVVGEGAETEAEWNLLKNLGCDYAQGWFAARPMPVEEFAQWRKLHPSFSPSPRQERAAVGLRA